MNREAKASLLPTPARPTKKRPLPMPRKSKKKAENAAVGETPAAGLHEPDEPELKTAPEAGTEAGKEAGAQAEVSPGADQAHAEAMAEAADTFEQAYEDRVPLEH